MEYLNEVVGEIDAALDRLEARGATPTEIAAERNRLTRTTRRGSRFVGEGASPSLVEHVNKGGSYSLLPNTASAPAHSRDRRSGGLAAAMTKALAVGTGTAGGYLVPPETASEIVKLIRARSAVMRLGPRVVPVKKQLNIVSIASGATAYYVAENAAIPASEETFAETPLLTPKELAALVPISNRLLRDASESPDVEDVIREDLAEVLALRADLAFLRGSGTGNEPRGVRNHSGLTAAPNLGANGATPTFDNLKDMVANLRTANAPFQRPGWVFHPRTINTLEKVKDGQQRYLADAGLHVRPDWRRRHAARVPVRHEHADPGQRHDRHEHGHERDLSRVGLAGKLGRRGAVTGDRGLGRGGIRRRRRRHRQRVVESPARVSRGDNARLRASSPGVLLRHDWRAALASAAAISETEAER